LISTSPCAPASTVMKASYSFWVGVCFTVFCAIVTACRIGPTTARLRSRSPRAAKLLRGEKRRVVAVLDSTMVLRLL
jgi:hypothetical protein